MANNSIGAYAQGGTNDIGAYEYAATGTAYTEVHTYTGTGTLGTLAKEVGKNLSFSGSGTSVFSRLAALSKALTYTGQGSSAFAKGLGKVLTYTGTGTLAFARQIAVSVILTFAGIGTLRQTNSGQADLEGAINPVDALPRDIPRIREFIAAQGGRTDRSLNDDYRDALCLAVGLTEAQALNVSIDDAWKLYAESRGL